MERVRAGARRHSRRDLVNAFQLPAGIVYQWVTLYMVSLGLTPRGKHGTICGARLLGSCREVLNGWSLCGVRRFRNHVLEADPKETQEESDRGQERSKNGTSKTPSLWFSTEGLYRGEECLVGKTREELLELLYQRQRSCPVKLAEKALDAWGFQPRKVKKERALWKLGSLTITLPQPKTKDLKPTYVRQVITMIEKAKAGEGNL